MCGSVLLNALLLLPGMAVLLTTTPSLARDADAAHDSQLQSDTPPPIELGIDDSTAATLTWIGHDEFMEHLADRAQFEQALLQTTQGDHAAGINAPPPHTPAAPIEPPPPAPVPAVELPSGGDATTAVTETLTPEPTPDPAPTSDPAPDPTPTPTPEPTPEPEPEPEPEPPSPPVPTTSEPDPTLPPGPKGRIDAPLRLHGTDRDADAASVLKVTPREMNLGKPLAHEGVKLLPVAPDWTALQSVTRRGRYHVYVRLVFDDSSRGHNGRRKPARTFIGHIPTSGPDRGDVVWSDEVDTMGTMEKIVKRSMHSWQAEGDAIDAITPATPVIINMQVQIDVR